MKISCNNLKKHLKNADKIDFLKIWDTFSIRTAEIEGIEVKGEDLKGIVVAQITECKKHPKKDKYSLLKISDGTNTYNVLCGAPNVRIGLKVAFVIPGGSIGDFTITEKEIAGFLSQGMCCSLKELGIGEDHAGILELPDDAPLGMDIREYLPIKDIIVEIDNKSLTNRPDLWGHYGIAREISAITGHELLPLELESVPDNLPELKIEIKNKELCNRFCGLRVDNITEKKSSLEMQIFLHYAGMRPINLLVDISNYVMLELAQPNHAYDSRNVDEIIVTTAKDKDKFTTLDNIERELTQDMLMIKNKKEYIGIAGVMGGSSSEIEDDTESVLIEAASFDSTSVRKTAIALGLRTEASARFEKSLDPNLASIAIERFLYLLKSIDPDIKCTSKLTDIYPNILTSPTINLKKSKLSTYLGFDMEDKEVIKILNSLDMSVEAKKDYYEVIVPTFRATKDISIEEDLIEEISRIYGYENFKELPLKLDLTFTEYENVIETEYKVKNFLSSKYDLHEVHTYLWLNTKFLNKLNITLDNPSLVGKTKDNILRNDLGLSLLEIASENLNYRNSFGIYEIGTIITNNENKRILSILLVNDDKFIKDTYLKAKDIAYKIFKAFKNYDIKFTKSSCMDYYNNDLSYEITYQDNSYGMIKTFHNKLTNTINKKKCFITIEIDFDKFIDSKKELHLFKEISKYPSTTLDYTIIMPKENKYYLLENILNEFKSPIILNYRLVDTYENKYTVRYTVGSYDKTLDAEELNDFKVKFIEHIKLNNLNIIE